MPTILNPRLGMVNSSRFPKPQRLDRGPRNRIDEIGRDLQERLKYEPALAKPRMRHDEPRFVDDGIAEQNQIEIERPRSVLKRTLASSLAFDGMQKGQELARRQRRVANAGRVQKRRLRVRDVHGLGVVVARHAQILNGFREAGDSEVEVRGAIAEIASERDRYSIHRTGST